MLKGIKKIFSNKSNPEPVVKPENLELFQEINNYVLSNQNFIYSHTKLHLKDCQAYQKLKNLKGDSKVQALENLISYTNKLDIPSKKYANTQFPFQRDTEYDIAVNILQLIMRTRIDFSESYNFNQLFIKLYASRNSDNDFQLTFRPFHSFIMQIEKHVKNHGLTNYITEQINSLTEFHSIKNAINEPENLKYRHPEIIESAKHITKILTIYSGEIQKVPIYDFGTGRMGSLFISTTSDLNKEDQEKWNIAFHHLATASGGKPNKKFIVGMNDIVSEIGSNQYKKIVNTWIQTAASWNIETQVRENSYGTYEVHEYIEQDSYNVLKGLLWSMSRFHDQSSLQNIAHLAEKCFQKIPGTGPAAASVGNAAIYALAESKGLMGISHLSRLKLRIRQNNTQKLIQKYIDEQAKKQGIKSSQVEEIAAYDYGLDHGIRVEQFDDYTFEIELISIGQVEQRWIKPDGSPQKTVPSFIKGSAKHTNKLKKLKDLAKQVKQASTTQRDRIDRLYLENLSWSREDFEKYYLNHGLISIISKRLIWSIDNQPALFIDNKWVDENSNEVTYSDSSTIHLWHPIESDSKTVLSWRDLLIQHEIKQPLKQAYREIYLLTDAEINTRIYSNRMAAHILKQHQFNSLAALRGWSYSLLGAYDDGRDGDIASKPLPDSNITAQFWINEIIDDTDSFNEAGIWFYIATDQVRFIDAEEEPVELINIPPLVFTEVMRDVDLFVGVASVGNDPLWQDGGPESRADYRQYWQSYSFGDLSEIAKTRKSVLERLLPRLKIKDKAIIDGKFLVVTGTKHTYKIHIGSGNILIAPNDKYLCIVPGRGKDKKIDKLFLPFEGDSGLSIVLSKAFLLVEDDKITDPTILSQI
jgi:hypothetical protein